MMVLVAASGLMMGGCAQFGGLDSNYNPFATAKAPEAPPPGQLPADELQRATDHWGKEFSKNPQDLQTGLNYARNLKALGDKKRAAAVLQQVSLFHSMNQELNSELGRLAVELDQLALAKKLLEAADDPSKPDWRVISARGTIMAKEGRTPEAIAFFERALALAPGQPSVTNNLALAYAMHGQAEKAEELLRTANVTGPDAKKVRQNLALVLGLQGKYDEATKVGSEVTAPATATANTELLKRMVKLEPKASADPAVPAAAWSTSVAAAPQKRAPDQGWEGQVIAAKPAATALRQTATETGPLWQQSAKVAGANSPIDLKPATQ
jgi:Flp pilus assembly protein TadD